jgi:hypothetical protein
MAEQPESHIIAESQLNDALTKFRERIVSGLMSRFEGTLGDRYGEISAEIVSAYRRGNMIVANAVIGALNLQDEDAMGDFCRVLCDKVYDDIYNELPDLRWVPIEVLFFQSTKDIEEGSVFFDSTGWSAQDYISPVRAQERNGTRRS